MRADSLANSRNTDYGLERPKVLRSSSVWGHPASVIARSGPKRAPARTVAGDTYDCFQSEERFFCRETGCAYRNECIRLVAAWKR